MDRRSIAELTREAMKDAKVPEIQELKMEMTRAINRPPRAMKRERPAIIGTSFANATAGVAMLVLGGQVETVSILTLFEGAGQRKCNYTFDLVSPNGEILSQRFQASKSLFAIAVRKSIGDGWYARLQVTPMQVNAEEKLEDVPLPLMVSFGVSLRVRSELLQLEELYPEEEGEDA